MTRLFLALLLFASVVHAQPFMVVRESCIYNATTQAYDFRITFNQPPDFVTEDWDGFSRHYFDYFVWWDGLQSCENMDRIVTCYSMRYYPWVGITLRYDCSYDDPNYAFVNGHCLGTADTITERRTVSFSVPVDLMGDADGNIQYRIRTRTFKHNDGYVWGTSSNTTPTKETTWGAVKALYQGDK